MYLQSISIKQARKKRRGGKDFFGSTSGSASKEWGDVAKRAEGGLSLFQVFFSAVCVCGPEWCLKTVLITFFIIIIYLCGDIPPSGIFEAVQRIFF